MRGEFVPVWTETWRDIWSKLAKHPYAPDDLFSEMYRTLVPAPTPPAAPPPAQFVDEEGRLIQPEDIEARATYELALTAYTVERAKYEEILGDNAKAKAAFLKFIKTENPSERRAVAVLESAFITINDYGVESLSNQFFSLVEAFLTKYSLRYDLRRPFTLHPTLTGVFARMFSELKAITKADVHLHQLMRDFEDAVRDLRYDTQPARIKACISRQMNLLEGIARHSPAITENTLGKICDQMGALPNPTWPHDRVKDAMKDLYKFASDYPGIRHGGNPANARLDIEMRDLVAISVLLAGFTPYLSHQVDSNIVYGG